ncbi:hypothetical protein TcCL_ESM05194 [Trypanosoma cruzi]|nr:hypothetical protein TcCL_ESM05194 [Trypanosoma cruzi]
MCVTIDHTACCGVNSLHCCGCYFPSPFIFGIHVVNRKLKIKRRLLLLLPSLIVCILVLLLLSYSEESVPRRPRPSPRTFVECEQSRRARAINFRGVVSRFCEKLCTASSKLFFCDRQRFPQARSHFQSDFPQTPAVEVRGRVESVDVVKIATWGGAGRRFGRGSALFLCTFMRRTSITSSRDDVLSTVLGPQFPALFSLNSLPRFSLSLSLSLCV